MKYVEYEEKNIEEDIEARKELFEKAEKINVVFWMMNFRFG